MSSKAYMVRGLTKVYRKTQTKANDNISLDIETGTIYAILGPNGAGKTSFVRQLAGLLRPTSGEISLLGHDVLANPGLVPTLAAYYGQKAVALQAHQFSEVLWITGLLRGCGINEAKKEASALMDRFEVTGLAGKLLARLSGGEMRLAALLSTFMGRRLVFILDEPTNDLDPLRRKILWSYLHERNSRDGSTFIVVSHNLPEVESVAGYAALIDQGVVAASGTIGELKKAVADGVRLEFRLRREDDKTVAAVTRIPGVSRVRAGLWMVMTIPEKATELLRDLLLTVDRSAIDDFRIVTPTLDDVYHHFTGKETRAHASN